MEHRKDKEGTDRQLFLKILFDSFGSYFRQATALAAVHRNVDPLKSHIKKKNPKNPYLARSILGKMVLLMIFLQRL